MNVQNRRKLIEETAKLLKVSPRIIFQLAAESRRCNDARYVGDTRYESFERYGAIPKYVEDFALSQWTRVSLDKCPAD